MTEFGVDKPILVTGATGKHGGTGRHLVDRLIGAGRAVRVLARRRTEVTDALAVRGAEVVIGDFFDRASLVRALSGTSAVSFTYPVNAGVVEAAASLAAAVRETGEAVRVVVTSMGAAHPQSPSHLGRAQWLAEEVLDWAGLDICVLRIAALFFENLSILHGASVHDEGVMRNSFGDAEVPWISGSDAALVAAEALLHPEKFPGRVHTIPGVEVLSHAAIAAVLSRTTGKPVCYQPVSRDDWAAELRRLAGGGDGGPVNPDMARHISALGVMFARMGGTTGAVPDLGYFERLTGRQPVTFEAFAAANTQIFGGMV